MLKSQRIFWLGFLVWVWVVGFLSLAPRAEIRLRKNQDKIIHFICYLPFGVVGYYHPRRGMRNILLVSLFGIDLGLLLELLQRRVPGRVCDGWDFLADALGVILGLMFLVVARGLGQRIKGWQQKRSADGLGEF